ncbi:MAG: hypothetical protein ACOCZ3_00105 [Bacillota bacterium]
MSNPINPHTLLPMSLQVDELEQARQLQLMKDQDLLSRKKIREDRLKQERVNQNQDPEKARVDSEDRENNRNSQQQTQQQQRSPGEQHEESANSSTSKGRIIDVKI